MNTEENFKSMTTRELVKICQSGNKTERRLALERIVKLNDSLIVHLIRKNFPTYQQRYMEDMMQEGRIAMCQYADKYDLSKNTTLSTFIAPYIISAVKKFICNIQNVSTYYAGQLGRYKKAIRDLAQEGNINPSLADISESMGCGLFAAQRISDLATHVNPISIEGDVKDCELANASGGSPQSIYESKERREQLYKAIRKLTKLQQRVIYELYFNSPDNTETPITEVADRLGLNTIAIRRQKEEALCALREADELSDYTLSDRLGQLIHFEESLRIEFALPEEEINANIDTALSIDDDEDEPDDIAI